MSVLVVVPFLVILLTLLLALGSAKTKTVLYVLLFVAGLAGMVLIITLTLK